MVTFLSTIDSLAVVPCPQIVEHGAVWSELWLWVALAEAVVIVLLLAALRYRTSTAYRQKQEVLAEMPDFGNVLSSAFHAEQLYRELIRRCHPDRYAPDQTKMMLANELAAQLAKHKHNLKELKRIEKEIQIRLY